MKMLFSYHLFAVLEGKYTHASMYHGNKCMRQGIEAAGTPILDTAVTAWTWVQCRIECMKQPLCNFWQWIGGSQTCSLLNTVTTEFKSDSYKYYVLGEKRCAPGKNSLPPIMLIRKI